MSDSITAPVHEAQVHAARLRDVLAKSRDLLIENKSDEALALLNDALAVSSAVPTFSDMEKLNGSLANVLSVILSSIHPSSPLPPNVTNAINMGHTFLKDSATALNRVRLLEEIAANMAALTEDAAALTGLRRRLGVIGTLFAKLDYRS